MPTRSNCFAYLWVNSFPCPKGAFPTRHAPPSFSFSGANALCEPQSFVQSCLRPVLPSSSPDAWIIPPPGRFVKPPGQIFSEPSTLSWFLPFPARSFRAFYPHLPRSIPSPGKERGGPGMRNLLSESGTRRPATVRRASEGAAGGGCTKRRRAHIPERTPGDKPWPGVVGWMRVEGLV